MKPASVCAEVWLSRRLGERALFAGVTTAEQRRSRVAVAIARRNIDTAQAGRRDGGPITFDDLFFDVYGMRVADAVPA